MRPWRKTLLIKNIMNDDSLDKFEKARAINSRLKASKEFQEDVIDNMEYAVEQKDINLWDAGMEEIYCIADDQRIWLG